MKEQILMKLFDETHLWDEKLTNMPTSATLSFFSRCHSSWCVIQQILLLGSSSYDNVLNTARFLWNCWMAYIHKMKSKQIRLLRSLRHPLMRHTANTAARQLKLRPRQLLSRDSLPLTYMTKASHAKQSCVDTLTATKLCLLNNSIPFPSTSVISVLCTTARIIQQGIMYTQYLAHGWNERKSLYPASPVAETKATQGPFPPPQGTKEVSRIRRAVIGRQTREFDGGLASF